MFNAEEQKRHDAIRVRMKRFLLEGDAIQAELALLAADHEARCPQCRIAAAQPERKSA